MGRGGRRWGGDGWGGEEDVGEGEEHFRFVWVMCGVDS